jgi:hypothetical protein
MRELSQSQQSEMTTTGVRLRLWLIPGAVWLLLLLGCSSLSLAEQAVVVSTPISTRQPVPTFTATPDFLKPLIVITPEHDGTPGVIILPPNVTPNLIFPPPPTSRNTDTPIPPTATDTPVPTGTPIPTPTFTPTPFVIVDSGFVSMRVGPGVNYPFFAQLGPNIPVAITGKNTQGDWYRICCVNDQNVWVAATDLRAVNDVSQVELVAAEPAPTPTFTSTPTETPTPTPYIFPFQRAEGPIFFPSNNPFLTIWVLLYAGPDNVTPSDLRNDPVPGYFLEVQYADGLAPDVFFDRPNTNEELPSFDSKVPPPSDPEAKFHWTASRGAGNRKPYNYKYEYLPYNPPRPSYPSATATLTPIQLLGTGTWKVWVKDGAGNPLSEPVLFSTDPNNPNREVYIAWRRIR